ncbi:hypothetical protein I3842_05G235800 [Carya illinoinensis]|uniref:Uncharacterized protein n=1 Tax=Carya illinoinensis TaxID=32201 RepID=A0A922JNQ8_CARIL|nr:hypothetical protein I3842_05G235800 [Carya illinoinensis]
MEIVNPSACYESLKRYWRRRRYQRLINGTANNNKRKLKIIRLGIRSTGAARRGFWRVRRSSQKLIRFNNNINAVSPIKLLAKFHDSYVDMMIRLVGNIGNLNNVDLFGGKRVPKGRQISMVCNGEEVDGRFVLEMYKRMASTREIGAL